MVPKIIKTIRQYLSGIDPYLFVAVLAILAISLINMYGVVGNDILLKKQAIIILIGIFTTIFLSFFNYRYFKNYSSTVLILYGFSIFLLALTFYSRSIRGTNSWLIFGNLTFEPAELMKLFLIILMAKYFSQKHVHINQFRYIAASGLYFIVPAFLIINQPDLGSAIILGLIWASLLVVSGISRKHLIALLILVLIFTAVSWSFVLKPYQKTRIISYLNQGEDPLGAGYNLIQSKIAIGSGHWLGNGWGRGSQSSLGFLPEPHNDFIFSAFMEQFGFMGGLSLLGLLMFVIYRIMLVGSSAASNFGKLFSIGLAVFIFSHVFVSTGVNIGLLPVTGLPFPFLSSGGSHLVSIMAGLGILQSIKRYG